MGNADSNPVRNVDKRTSRREHRGIFEEAVRRFRANPFEAPAHAGFVKASVVSGADGSGGGALDRFVRVCVRKRPIFPHETAQGEFDVVSCLPGRVVIHDARMHPDMRHMFINHHDFAFDEAFSEQVNNDEVYARTARSLVENALGGACGTVMMYGQTGSGKTYTMSAVYERVAQDLFAGLSGTDRKVFTTFVELSGDKCFDMLNAGELVNLTQGGDGSVHPYPCVEVEVKDASELLAMITLATKLRATAATGVHDQSSRSHAVCRIYIDGASVNGLGLAAATEAEGSLTLVDLAGSEHRVDSSEHNAERRKEGAKINASLAALKDCIRGASRGAKFVAFRQNRLTQLLRGCFSRLEKHETVVIATVSPSSKDTEHSTNTLRHACIMDGQKASKEQKDAGGGPSHVTGGVVTKENLGEIDVAKIAREKRAQAKAEGPPDEWGKSTPEIPAHQLKQSNLRARAALDRKAMHALNGDLKQALLNARQEWGSLRQRARIGRAGAASAQAQEKGEESPQAKTAGAARAAKSKEEAGGAGGDGGADGDGGGGNDLANETEQAFELFRAFSSGGRGAREWRKNDLRIINSCVVPMLFGKDRSLDWNHPNLALDQLEQMVQEMSAPGAALCSMAAAFGVGRGGVEREGGAGEAAGGGRGGGGAASSSARPPRPGGGGAEAPRRRASAAPSGYPDDPSSGAPSGGLPRTPSAGSMASSPSGGGAKRGSVGGGGRANAAAAAAAAAPSPARGRTQPEPPPSPGGDGSRVASAASSAASTTSHRDSVRARREAMERERQKSIQKALEKRDQQRPAGGGGGSGGGGGGVESEIAALEEQIASGKCSAAAVVGLKKRIAAMKAAMLREKRLAEQKAREQQRQQQPPPQQAPPPRAQTPQAEEPQQNPRSAQLQQHLAGQREAPSPAGTPSSGRFAGGGGSTPGGGRGGGFGFQDDLPEPAVPPPRSGAGTPMSQRGQYPSGPGAYSPAGGGFGGCGFEAGGGRRGAPRAGAASAPWGNAFTDGDE